MSYTTYLFDLDGTLLDSVELIVASHRHTRSVHFGDVLPDAHYIATMGRTLVDVYGEIARDAAHAAAMIATYREWNLAHHDAMVRPYPGVAAMLQALHASGKQLAVVTSKRRALAVRGLQIAGLEPYFPVVVGGDDVARGKPDPQPVLHALAALGVGSESAVMVGDSTHDMQAARRADVRTAAALWGPVPRDVLLASEPDHLLGEATDVLAM